MFTYLLLFQANCSKGFHLDVRYFQLKQMYLPSEVEQLYLEVQLIHEEAIAETYNQQYALIVKNTERLTEVIANSGELFGDKRWLFFSPSQGSYNSSFVKV